jgi:CCR4-NOT transcription complex subunit 3
MEKFKAVEKAMKTKAYSKEGLSAATKLDPKEQAKQEVFSFLSDQVDELERQIETLEAEGESIQATMKKGKNQSSKADRMAEIERITERHKWHQAKLELIKRSLENDRVETEQVTNLQDSIKYYVSDGMNDEYMEDDEMYEELNLQEDEDNFGMNNENDRVSSQDTQSVQEDIPDTELRIPSGKAKAVAEPPVAAARRPSTQMKSPLPAMSTLHTPSTNTPNGTNSHMKPAAVPTRAPGEGLKYASAAAAAAASDKMGIAPLPPPPESLPSSSNSMSHPPLPSHAGRSTSVTASPTATLSQPALLNQTPLTKPSAPSSSHMVETPSSTKSPALSLSSAIPSGASASQPPERVEAPRSGPSRGSSGKAPAEAVEKSKRKSQLLLISVHIYSRLQLAPPQSNGTSNGLKVVTAEDPDESIYHLPSGLQDLLQSFEATQRRVTNAPSQSSQRMLAASYANCPETVDILAPRTYKPKNPIRTPTYYPQELDPIFDDPRLYSRIDPDTLFYVFYYKQETYQQYLAAKALKDQSWRFHKQYQTWFQRHEEPKTITEEFEQGTYRFFDYESTWWVPILLIPAIQNMLSFPFILVLQTYFGFLSLQNLLSRSLIGRFPLQQKTKQPCFRSGRSFLRCIPNIRDNLGRNKKSFCLFSLPCLSCLSCFCFINNDTILC